LKRLTIYLSSEISSLTMSPFKPAFVPIEFISNGKI
jgi:hypothetical protein